MASAYMPLAAAGSEAFPAPTPRRRRSQPVDLTRYRRERIEGLIETLIGMLDAADECDDHEPGQDDDACAAEDAAIMRTGGNWLPGDPEDGEPCDDDERSVQPAMTPDSVRPTAALPWPRNVL